MSTADATRPPLGDPLDGPSFADDDTFWQGMDLDNLGDMDDIADELIREAEEHVPEQTSDNSPGINLASADPSDHPLLNPKDSPADSTLLHERAKLDFDRLLSKGGLPKLRRIAKKFKVREGKDSEFENLRRLMLLYQVWAHELFPKVKFENFITRVERLCRTKRMQMFFRAAMNAEKRSSQDDTDNALESDEPEQELETTEIRPMTSLERIKRLGMPAEEDRKQLNMLNGSYRDDEVESGENTAQRDVKVLDAKERRIGNETIDKPAYLPRSSTSTRLVSGLDDLFSDED